MTRPRLSAWSPSRIGLRLLAFNLLVVFVPVIGVWYLDVYETRLLQAQERAMVQQGRMLAASVAADGLLDPTRVTAILTQLDRQTDARFRVYDAAGTLVADSVRAAAAAPAVQLNPYDGSASAPSSVRGRLLYRVGVLIVRVRQKLGGIARAVIGPRPSAPSATDPSGVLYPEVRAALNGRYGAATRQTPGQRSLTLFSAVPVKAQGTVVGAVLTSQSTYRVLQAIYDVRLRIFEVVVASIAAAAVLTTLAAMTIVRPLRRLRRQAAALTGRGALPTSFPGADRKDELGDLARALEELARRVTDHIGQLEGFAADVSHEFKNPLASIRAAAEMIGESERPEDRQRFLTLMFRDVDRLERLVTGLRNLARIDGELEHQELEDVGLADAVRSAADAVRAAGIDGTIVVEPSEGSCTVRGSREHLVQVFENLLSNAVSFSPSAASVEVRVGVIDGVAVATVSDRGPGIPDGHLTRIFERFFTYRPASGRREHVGLGLSIARRIVERYGGSLAAANREGGGAVFEVRLPVVASRTNAEC